MEEKLNLFQKLAKIRAISDVVKKEKSGFNYKYADITAILAKITAGMKKYGVSLIPRIVPGTSHVEQNVVTNTKIDKTGKPFNSTTTEMVVTADMVFKWVDDETQEYIEVPWFVTGAQSDPSQAFGSGLTYCTRYFLCNYFQIAQPDSDVDKYRSQQKEAEAAEEKAIAGEIIAQFNTVLKAYLADHPEDKDTIAKFISKYEKKSNYFAIKDPVLAGKLLNDFTNTYLNKEGE